VEKKGVMLIAALVLLIVLVVIGIASQPKEMTREEAINSMFSKADPEKAKELSDSFKITQASLQGDTYCKKCEKVNPGRVRICTYCGQYIN
jgi:hypothetical protein